MPEFDHAFMEQTLDRLRRLSPDAKPLWGQMNQSQLVGHLNIVLKHTMGDSGVQIPFKGNFVSKNFFKHLILHDIIPIPKGIKVPRPVGMKEMPPPPEATLEELRATMQEYLDRKEQKKLPAESMHPFFGPLTPKQWARFHRAHFKHHLKQFGVWN